MKMYYITLDSEEMAKKISLDLIENRLAACTNIFPVSSVYRWDGEIQQDREAILIVKTKSGMREKIEACMKRHINYTNCIAEIDVESINPAYGSWLTSEVKTG